MRKNNLHRAQKSTVFSQKAPESFSIKLNNNPDAWLLDYAKTIIDLEAQKEAVQFTDDLMTSNEARNYCIIDDVQKQTQELNHSIKYHLSEMAHFQAFTFAGLQAKARALKAVTTPLHFDEGFVSYEANLLLTSLLVDVLGGVKQ